MNCDNLAIVGNWYSFKLLISYSLALGNIFLNVSALFFNTSSA